MTEKNEDVTNENHSPSEPDGYEAPRIETVVTGEELEREVHYAGIVSGPA